MRIGNLRVVIYPNDHIPAHVHVIGNGNEAVWNLNCPSGPVSLRENHGFSQADLSRIEDALNPEVEYLCGRWWELHG